MTLLRSAALSDIGRVRRQNEDRLINDAAALLFGVADGVGGLPGGAEAAQRSIELIASSLHAVAGSDTPDLAAVVQHVNFQVRAVGLALSPSTGIGSTLTFGLIRDQTLHIAHVGDSRCYGWRAGQLEQLTEDHSVENEARLRRARGEPVYYQDINRNALTRCMGQPGMPEVDLIDRPLQAGDRYLFCTDGITRLVQHAELAELIGRAEEPEPALRDIIALAIRRGGPDNATGVLLFIDEP